MVFLNLQNTACLSCSLLYYYCEYLNVLLTISFIHNYGWKHLILISLEFYECHGLVTSILNIFILLYRNTFDDLYCKYLYIDLYPQPFNVSFVNALSTQNLFRPSLNFRGKILETWGVCHGPSRYQVSSITIPNCATQFPRITATRTAQRGPI